MRPYYTTGAFCLYMPINSVSETDNGGMNFEEIERN
jgi:hypothetical protein